jgi:hypothetical protein
VESLALSFGTGFLGYGLAAKAGQLLSKTATFGKVATKYSVATSVALNAVADGAVGATTQIGINLATGKNWSDNVWETATKQALFGAGGAAITKGVGGAWSQYKGRNSVGKQIDDNLPVRKTPDNNASHSQVLNDPWLDANDIPVHSNPVGKVNPQTSDVLDGWIRQADGSIVATPSRMLPANSSASLVGGADRLPSIVYQSKRKTLFHYTSEDGLQGILDSKQLRASKGFDAARSGDGQYLTDLSPDRIVAVNRQNLTQKQIQNKQISLQQAAAYLFGRGGEKTMMKMRYFVEIDITDLPIRQSLTTKGDKIKEHVQFLLNQGELDLTGRIVNHGKTL